VPRKVEVQIKTYSKPVLLNLLGFRSPLPSITVFPFTLFRMHVPRDDVTTIT